MSIEGITISRAGDRTKRAEAAAAKTSANARALQIDAERQRMFALQALRSNVDNAGREVKRLQREAADIDANISEAREEMARTGKRDPDLFRLTFEANEMPNIIAGAEAKFNALRNELADALDRQAEADRLARARAAAEAELNRLAAERAEQLEALTAAHLAAEPVDDAPRGRGRPRKVA